MGFTQHSTHKFFNTAGPINTDKHYFISHRLDEDHILKLIFQEKYFILHAPRQSGKTTAIMQLVRRLNATGEYRALYVNFEAAQTARSNVKDGIEIILGELRSAAKQQLSNTDPLTSCINESIKLGISGISLKTVLQDWSMASTKPIVLFIDEIDALVGDTLISVLRQIRSGYTNRPKAFPQSICLFGVRDVRDYRIWSDENQSMILGGSAFNIKSESLILADFNLAQVQDLYGQHTAATGQQFDPEAIEYAFYLTQGQPWLVNALADQVCFRDITDRTQVITKASIERAKEALIMRRDTHIDVLVDRLEEPRVANIIDLVLHGSSQAVSFNDDDVKYVQDLGLIKRGNFIEIANPIYQEIIPRELSMKTQKSISEQSIWYIENGLLNINKLLTAFQQFYLENSAIWLEKFIYKESGPHLLLLAFLQRIINGGGSIHREYALGRKRCDLLICWPLPNPIQRIVIELKIKRNEKTIPEGLTQTYDYMQETNATEGHLVVFDRGNNSWDDKLFVKTKTINNKIITVWGV